MIDRANWMAMKEYLEYRRDVDQLSPRSIRLEEAWLRHLLEWADSRPLSRAPKITPPFPSYVMSLRKPETSAAYSQEYTRKVISSAKRFLGWCSTHKQGYRLIDPSYLDTLKPPRQPSSKGTHEYVTLEEVRDIATAPARLPWERRIRAAAVFLFLSGARVGAFVSLPLEAIDLETRTVKQWPSLGVKTKFGKAATTFLLDLPDLIDLVMEWDAEVREVLPPRLPWFAPLSCETGEIDPTPKYIGAYRDARLRKELNHWTDKVGLPYHSPHRFRHGHAVYALKQARDIADLKAVSQNLMHSNLSITDGVYGVLSEEDTRNRILELGSRQSSMPDGTDLEAIADAIAMRLWRQMAKPENAELASGFEQ